MVKWRLESQYRNWITFMLLCTLLLGACQAPPEPEHTITINFVSNPAFGSLESYVAQFEADNPDVRINVTYPQQISPEWPKHFDAALLSDAPGNQQPELWLDLTPLIESDLQFNADDYVPGALATGYVGGYLAALPVNVSYDVLVYNPLQLSAAGAPLPTWDWSWEDFNHIVLTLARHYEQGNNVVFAGTFGPSVLLLGWLSEQATPSENIQGRPMPLLDRPAMLSALPRACSLLSELTVDPAASAPASEHLSRLQSGQAALTILPYGLVRNLLSEHPDLSTNPLPQPSKNLRIADSLAISRGTSSPQATWEWLGFLSQQYLPYFSSNLPARKSVLESQRVLETLDAGATRVARAILADHGPLAEHKEPVQIIKMELWDALFKTCKQGIPADTALKSAQEAAQEKLAAWYDDQQAQPTTFSVIAPASEDKTTKTLNFVALDANEQFYRAAAEAFSASYPEWSIQFGGVVPEETSKADCVSLQLPTFDMFVIPSLKDGFLSFGSMIELDSALNQDNFFPQAIQAIAWQGRSLGIPLGIKPLVLYYDPAVFWELGLSPPTSEWSVADMLDSAQEIRAAAPHQLGYAPRAGAEVRFVLEQQGISLFNAGPPLEPRFAASDVLVAIEQLRALQGGHGVVSNGVAAMILSTFYGNIPSGNNWRAVALEPYPDTVWPSTLYLGAVNKSSSNAQLAWEWLAFLAQRDGAHGDDVLPAIQLLAMSERTRLELDQELHAAYLLALEQSTTRVDPEKTLIQNLAASWFDLAIMQAGTGDLEPALEQAQDKARQFINCQASAGQMDLPTLAACAKQVDPEHWLAQLSDD